MDMDVGDDVWSHQAVDGKLHYTWPVIIIVDKEYNVPKVI
jgi:hypothetical protein